MLKKYGKEAALMIVAGGIVSYFFPWWVLAVATGLVALFMSEKNILSYAAGFTAGTVLWTFWATYIDMQNGAVLSMRIGELFKGLTPAQLIAATGFLGALIGSMGALTGASLRRILPFLQKEKALDKELS